MASGPSNSSVEDKTDEVPAKQPGHNKFAERDLKNEKYCTKNRGHAGFIPTGEFSKDYLPHLYHDEDVFQLVKATSDLTFLLKRSGDSSQTNSESKFTPRRSGENGTGWVTRVEKYTVEDDMDCDCDECHNSGTCPPRKEWAEIYMKTAAHLVHNDAEAKLTKCSFFFDSNDLSISERPSLTGLKVVESKMEGDTCEMMCATHDRDLVHKLYGMYRRWFALNIKVHDKYSRCDARPVQGAEGGSSDKKNNVCIIVSHPHGHSKHITVGTWTQESTTVDDDRYVQQRSYEYSTPTCPGSSGAPVITLPKDGVRILCWSNYAAHSRGPKNAPNRSAGVREATQDPQNQND